VGGGAAVDKPNGNLADFAEIQLSHFGRGDPLNLVIQVSFRVSKRKMSCPLLLQSRLDARIQS